ncbi:hypothetical protein RJ639_014268 [Escallonia herrerae]|uniref:Cyclic nucleotide-binding domain-containing protein n=1 Tax=Escallonia herrerae TaxID=1293975 RepID=A0AA88VIT2_9ASTE|nr:hypothetical protein RJ639_014268 [Escallonia herrerae]
MCLSLLCLHLDLSLKLNLSFDGAVIEFLGYVPLLQRLPSSSLKKIAHVVIIKNYEQGDYVVREGEAGDGIYFIWEGEAEVRNAVHDGNRPEFQLKQYDFFGHGMALSAQHADVIALSKLTCLVLPHAHADLMQPISIWNADKTLETCSLVEHILHLEPLEVNLFRGITLPNAPKFGKALAAASKTVDCLKIVHSLHAYFLLVGDVDMPIIYYVHRVRDGSSFATRRVDAIQKGNVVFTLVASFQKEEQGFDHQEAAIPSVPDPEVLLSMEELRERRLTDPRLPSLRYWFRAKGKLSDDQALHSCVAAYTSDLIFLQVSVNPHRHKGLKTSAVSLDHSCSGLSFKGANSLGIGSLEKFRWTFFAKELERRSNEIYAFWLPACRIINPRGLIEEGKNTRFYCCVEAVALLHWVLPLEHYHTML